MATSGEQSTPFSGRPRFALRLAYARIGYNESDNSSQWRVSLRVDNLDGSTLTYALGEFPYQVNFNGAAWKSGNTPAGVFDFRDGASYHNVGVWDTAWMSHDAVGTIEFTLEGAVSTSSIFGSATVGPYTVSQDQHRLPDAPSSITLGTVTATSLAYSWGSADGNGSPILEYQIQLATDSAFKNEVSAPRGETLRSYTFTGLDPSKTYYARARARTSPGWGPWTETRSGTTMSGIPGAPGVPSGTFVAPSTIDTSWTAAPTNGSSIQEYQVERATNSTFTAGSVVSSAGTALSFSHTGLSYGVTYYFRARARSAQGWGAWSAASAGVLVPNVPSAPNPSVAFVAPTTLDLSWTAPANGGATITGYELQEATNASFSDTVTIYSGTALSYSRTGRTRGVTYYYRLRAQNSQGWSNWSATDSYAVPDVPTIPATPTTSFTAPTALAFNWTAPANGGAAITDYEIQIANTSGGVSSAPITSKGTALSHSVTGVRGTYYYLRVRAENSQGVSEWSPIASFRVPDVPAAPTGLVSSDVLPTSMKLSWTAPSDNGGAAITGYTLQRWNGTSWVGVYTGTALTFTDTGLTPGTEYRYRVLATNSQGNSAPSAELVERTLSGAYYSDGTTWTPCEVFESDGTSWRPVVVLISDGSAWEPAG